MEMDRFENMSNLSCSWIKVDESKQELEGMEVDDNEELAKDDEKGMDQDDKQERKRRRDKFHHKQYNVKSFQYTSENTWQIYKV